MSLRILVGSALITAGLLPVPATVGAAEPSGPAPPQITAVPSTMAFQGFLRDSSGVPIDGGVTLQFSLYNAPSGGAAVWTDMPVMVSVVNGVFDAAIGSTNPLSASLFDGAPLWLGISVNGQPELPRTPLRTSPFAFRAAVADSAVAVGVGDDGDWTISGNDVYRTLGRVGIGTATPFALLDMNMPSEVFDGIRMRVGANMTPAIDFGLLKETSGQGYAVSWLFMNGGGSPLSLVAGDDNTAVSNVNMRMPNDQTALLTTWSSQGGAFSVHDAAAQPVISLSGTATGDAAVQLPAGSVNATETASEPGVAGVAFDSNVNLSGGIQAIVSRTITVPADGWVLAMASMQIEISHSSSTGSIGIFGLSDDGVAFGTAQDVDVILPTSLPGGQYFLPFHSSALFAVTAGARTFYVLGNEALGAFTTREMSLNLVFLPTAYGTVDPVVAQPARSDVDAPGRPAMSTAEIAAERLEAARFDADRVARELDLVEARTRELRATLAALSLEPVGNR